MSNAHSTTSEVEEAPEKAEYLNRSIAHLKGVLSDFPAENAGTALKKATASKRSDTGQ
ncbi:hypothetical protein HY772_03630 [Candidatus Woesearchaeota archaeon]|nr:hypothetical protein [Candidatus Woesearchaeota archaeon]